MRFTFRQHFFSHSIMSFINKYLANVQGMFLIILPVLFNEKGRGSFNGSDLVSYYVETRQIMEGRTHSSFLISSPICSLLHRYF